MPRSPAPIRTAAREHTAEPAPERPPRPAAPPAAPSPLPSVVTARALASRPAIRLSPPSGLPPESLPAPVRAAVTSPGAGNPLPAQVAVPLAASFNADVGSIRVHTDRKAQEAAELLGVRAFTWGVNVYLAEGEQPTDLPLIAHELAHAIQQGGEPAVQLFGGVHDPLEHEAARASAAAARGAPAVVRGRTSGPAVQGLLGWVRRKLAALKNRVLGWLRDHARSVPGYDLLAFALGRDPISQDKVDRNAVNLIKGVVGLIPGGAAIFDNLQRARVIQRAYAWFSAEIGKLNLTWSSIRGLFARAWDALSIGDLRSPGRAWEKIKAIFGPPLARIRDFAVAAGRKALEFVFEGALALAGGAAGRVLAVFRRIGGVFGLIVSSPVRFLSHLVGAVKGGITLFQSKIGAHLRTGIFEWLVGAMRGTVQLPSVWDYAGILSLILQILGLTYAALREILVKTLGAPAVEYIETAFDWLRLIVTKGLVAAWEKIKEYATGLADTLIQSIRGWAARSVVGAAVARLVMLFNPVGAIIQAIIAVYNTVMFFIERAQQIARLVNAVLDSVENIARGNLGAAIAYIEKTMAAALPVILGFLARFAGLGNVSGHVLGFTKRVRTAILSALERVARWIADRVKGLLAARAGGARPSPGTAQEAPRATAVKAAALGDARRALTANPLDSVSRLRHVLGVVSGRHKRHGLKRLTARSSGQEPLSLEISAAASEPTDFVLPWAQAFRAHRPRAKDIALLRTAFAKQGYETTAAITVDGAHVVTATSNGLHAEERLIKEGGWDLALQRVAQVVAVRGSAELILLINRSPCHTRCTPELARVVKEARSKYPTVTFVLAPTGVYEPSVEVPEAEIQAEAERFAAELKVPLEEGWKLALKRGFLRESRDTPENERKGGLTTGSDIRELLSAGWRLAVLQARPTLTWAGKIWQQGIRFAVAEQVTEENTTV
ncbi:DUF4157 domain-containing protein [Thermopolyspora sp. NPDC052614]|uniref:eCIS core domain-containing protein n=1 Tax=Thermopolyspora sp. NPDC052614 TaxID=3155682 RepID=UPI00341AF0B8